MPLPSRMQSSDTLRQPSPSGYQAPLNSRTPWEVLAGSGHKDSARIEAPSQKSCLAPEIHAKNSSRNRRADDFGSSTSHVTIAFLWAGFFPHGRRQCPLKAFFGKRSFIGPENFKSCHSAMPESEKPGRSLGTAIMKGTGTAALSLNGRIRWGIGISG